MLILATTTNKKYEIVREVLGMFPREIFEKKLLGERYGAYSPHFFNCAIWCILKCILIKYQSENSLKISVFIAKTAKKDASLLGGYAYICVKHSFWVGVSKIVEGG